MKIRSFLAIELPHEIILQLGEIQNALKSSSSHVKWVKPGNIHLTLKFFGSIEEKTIYDISRIVNEVASMFNDFQLHVRDIGAFPNMVHPRVLWIGVHSNEGTLTLLHKEIETSLQKIGFQPEGKRFHPHLTLGRVKTLKEKRQLLAQVEKLKDCNLGSFRVESLFLFQSELRPAGAVYTKLKDFGLGRLPP